MSAQLAFYYFNAVKLLALLLRYIRIFFEGTQFPWFGDGAAIFMATITHSAVEWTYLFSQAHCDVCCFHVYRHTLMFAFNGLILDH